MRGAIQLWIESIVWWLAARDAIATSIAKAARRQHVAAGEQSRVAHNREIYKRTRIANILPIRLSLMARATFSVGLPASWLSSY